MFNSLEEAIAFGENSQKRENDGGVPIFEKRAVAKRIGEDVEWVDEYWVKIFNKADPKNIMEMSVREDHKKRWPEQWRAFLAQEEPDIDGIPLDDFPKMTPAERARCKQLKLMSVEDLVNYPDGQIKDLGGRGHELQKAARAFLEYSSGQTVQELRDEIRELKRKLADATDGIENNPERSAGNQPPKAVNSDAGESGLGQSSDADSGDDRTETYQERLAGSGEGTRVQSDEESADLRAALGLSEGDPGHILGPRTVTPSNRS